jgi:NAD(P)-dependent dehydrogenase (short-subunit alcohol dehydrogenase family)
MADATAGSAGQVVLITGAGAGIGRHYAHRFAAEGASIAVADLDEAAAKRVADEVVAGGGCATYHAMDVADEDAVTDAVASAAKAFGGIDVLVNNAGIHLGEAQVPYTLAALPRWRAVFEVNVLGALACAIACRPFMLGRENPSIINHSTMAAYGPTGAYGASKLALNSLTLSLATEYGRDGIRVNGIAPGLVDSESAVAWMGDAGRAGLQESLVAAQAIRRPGRMADLADVALFLASPRASFVTGQTILVDGGATKRPA